MKHNHKGNYKDGRTLKQYYCVDCEEPICWQTAIYKTGRCVKCSHSKKHNGNYKHGKCFNNKCKDCGKIVSYYNERCRDCWNIELSKLYQGSGNPFWKNGSSTKDYPIEWTSRFKEKIRARDNYICQECGIKEKECNRKLHVHHIDYDKENLDPKNLISLCHEHHSIANGNRRYWEQHFKNKVSDLVLV